MKDIKFLDKFSQLMTTPPPASAPTAPTAQAAEPRRFGFGASYANRSWTPPTERPIPADFLRRKAA